MKNSLKEVYEAIGFSASSERQPGVDASFAMQGDITLAEPGARIGFAGPRVIEKSLKQALPKDFQRAERVLSCGFVDAIVPRSEQKAYLAKVLAIHEM